VGCTGLWAAFPAGFEIAMKKLLHWYQFYKEGVSPLSLTTSMREVKEVYTAWLKLKQFGKLVEELHDAWQKMCPQTDK
jgi:hypothetical protein